MQLKGFKKSLLLLAVLVGCSKGSKVAEPDPLTQDEPPMGRFFYEKSVSEKIYSEFTDNGCDYSKGALRNYRIDPTLKVNDTWTSWSYSKSISVAPYRTKTKRVIKEKTSTSVSAIIELDDLSANGERRTSVSKWTHTLIPSETPKEEVIYLSKSENHDIKTYERCGAYGDYKYNTKYWKGLYELPDGRIVPAVKVEHVRTGSITCTKTKTSTPIERTESELGQGTARNVYIYAKGKWPTSTNCAGDRPTKLYKLDEVKDLNNKLIYINKVIEDAPLR